MWKAILAALLILLATKAARGGRQCNRDERRIITPAWLAAVFNRSSSVQRTQFVKSAEAIRCESVQPIPRP